MARQCISASWRTRDHEHGCIPEYKPIPASILRNYVRGSKMQHTANGTDVSYAGLGSSVTAQLFVISYLTQFPDYNQRIVIVNRGGLRLPTAVLHGRGMTG